MAWRMYRLLSKAPMSHEYSKGKVLEIVERRSDGLWYTSRRVSNPDEWSGSARWLQNQPLGRYEIRWVLPTDEYLSASYYWKEQSARRAGVVPMSKKDTTVSYGDMTEDKARRQGMQLGHAFSHVFVVQTNTKSDGVYMLARTIADTNPQLDDKDLFFAFCDGFASGFSVPSVPALEAGS